MNPTFENFETVLKFHDWNYDYSDSHAVYRKGSDEDTWLNNAFRELAKDDKAKTTEIWNKYAPQKWKK